MFTYLGGGVQWYYRLYYSAILVGKRRIGMFLGVISSEHFARLEFKQNTSGVAIRHYNTSAIIQIVNCSEIQAIDDLYYSAVL